MAGTPDLFVVCKKCGSEVSPYITECPYCGTRLRKRAPKIDRRTGDASPRSARKLPRPMLTPLRRDEIPGIRADAFGRPNMTIALIVLSLVGYLILPFVADRDLGLVDLHGAAWKYVVPAFVYPNAWYQLAVLFTIGIFGWRLELRHGPLLVLALFVACGLGGNAIAAAVNLDDFIFGAPGAALGMLAAWVLPDLVRARRGVDYDGDLIGTAVLGIVVAVMPAVAWGASAIATFSGLVLGALAGLMLLRTQDTTR
ncbi:MAG TPA: rhomboid family intramembrane serine protease [Baekduia sp.]|uniref:rhomboid family intramembrane serine protease n=1 Tax=Baekduia sp. TaxID=2600305 RepID=UPI002D77F321|nr:rhomboid family intramembrane serine protease [Baekduia sp.]HET6506903.1 rhomboid family intramembrane serine protease [Baekduia sp.]